MESVRDFLLHLARLTEKAGAVQPEPKRVEKILGAHVVTGRAGHIQAVFEPATVFHLPKEIHEEMAAAGGYSLYANLVEVMKEGRKEVPGEEDWVEAHRRTVEKLRSPGESDDKYLGAREYLSHLLAGAAAHQLLGGRIHIPPELRSYVEMYGAALQKADKEVLENLANHYRWFSRAIEGRLHLFIPEEHVE